MLLNFFFEFFPLVCVLYFHHQTFKVRRVVERALSVSSYNEECPSYEIDEKSDRDSELSMEEEVDVFCEQPSMEKEVGFSVNTESFK